MQLLSGMFLTDWNDNSRKAIRSFVNNSPLNLCSNMFGAVQASWTYESSEQVTRSMKRWGLVTHRLRFTFATIGRWFVLISVCAESSNRCFRECAPTGAYKGLSKLSFFSEVGFERFYGSNILAWQTKLLVVFRIMTLQQRPRPLRYVCSLTT